MKLKGLVWFFTIALTVISVWELSYTWIVRNYESKVRVQAEKMVKEKLQIYRQMTGKNSLKIRCNIYWIAQKINPWH